MSLTNGLISQWLANNSGEDSIGSHDMSSVSPSGYSVDAHLGSHALDYDGIDDKSVIPDHNDFSFGDALDDSPFSIFAWIKMNDATNFRIFSKNLWGTSYEYAFYFTGGDALRVSLYDNSSAHRIDRFSTVPYTGDEGTYCLYGITYDGSGTVAGLKLYRCDARIITSNSFSGSYVAMHNTSSDVTLGVIDNLAGFADGLIDTVYVWDRALTDGSVAEGNTVGTGSDIDLLWNGGAGIEITVGGIILPRRGLGLGLNKGLGGGL